MLLDHLAIEKKYSSAPERFFLISIFHILATNKKNRKKNRKKLNTA